MDAWGGVHVAETADNGNLTQLFPTWVSAGVAKASATSGEEIRYPEGGQLLSAQVQTDGTNGGTIELWDLSGADAGADVSTATAITNTQLLELQSRGLAKLMWSQDFSADAGARTASARVMPFMRGLAARYYGGGGSSECWLNIVADGGFSKKTKIG